LGRYRALFELWPLRSYNGGDGVCLIVYAKATEGGDDAEDHGGCDVFGSVPSLVAGCASASLGFCALGIYAGIDPIGRFPPCRAIA
jgi:hypothetical protein